MGPQELWVPMGFLSTYNWNCTRKWADFCTPVMCSSLLPSIIVVPGVLDLKSLLFSPDSLKGSPSKSVKAYHPNSNLPAAFVDLGLGQSECLWHWHWCECLWHWCETVVESAFVEKKWLSVKYVWLILVVLFG